MTNLYKTQEWQSLDGVDRAQLLLVIEGLKKGTIIDSNWTSFMDVLNKTGLDYELNTDKYSLKPVAIVARPQDLLEINRRHLILPKNADSDEYHKIAGWLLGYPECCTEEYVKERTPKQVQAKMQGQRHLSYRFGQELTAMIESEGEYPEVLNYRPSSFTPCSVDCPEATKVLTSWKEALETLDPEAAKKLIDFNRHSKPSRFAQIEALNREYKQQVLEYKLGFIRESVE